MDKPTQRENFLLGYASKRSFEGPSSSQNLDFNDVFGGPPRRFSLQEKTRHSSDGSVVDADDQTALFRRLSNEKPVYGEESDGSSSMNSRRKSLQNSDFYDDIFQGDQKYSSTSPQKGFLNYLPQSLHNMSPSLRTLPPKSEPVGSLFSLPLTMKEGMNSPAFGSSSSLKQKNVTSHGISSTTFSLSRFSSQPMQENDDLKNDVYTSNRPRPLSNEFPKEESSNVTKVNETEEISYRLKRSYSSNERIRSDKAQVKREETIHIVEEDIPIRPKPDVLETTQITVEKLPDNVDTPISLTEETAKIISKSKDKSFRMEVKSLRSILQDEIERLDNEDVVMKRKGEGKTAKTTKESRSNNGGNKTQKKREKKKTNSDIVEANKATTNTPGSPKQSGVNINRRGVGGKVKDFAKIFNQEMNSKPKSDARNQSQSCRWEKKLDGEGVNKGSFSTKQMNYIDMNKMPDSFFMVNENVVKPEKKHSYKLKGGSQSSESILDDSQVISDDSINDDPFQESYLIEELYDDQDNVAETSEDLESTKDLDTEIVKWSTGKIGNIRSLLSTLHYVLWEESGWSPVPLVDIIEGNAVKRAYQKALLCLHPDKLQQKGVASHQKYIAEKVFEILQEAWDHFNTLGSI